MLYFAIVRRRFAVGRKNWSQYFAILQREARHRDGEQVEVLCDMRRRRAIELGPVFPQWLII